MKKLLGVFFSILFLMSPIVLRAEEEKKTKIDLSNYKTMDFKETLTDEEMTLKNANYSETDDQITIYLFRGKGCGYCRSFLTFLNGISEEYGKYFKVKSFESWYDENNSKLMQTIAGFLGQEAGGVPYIIIGDKVFPGYADTYNDGIKEAITSLYDSQDRYDVFEAYNDSIKFKLSDTAKVVIWNIIITSVAAFIVIKRVKANNEKLIRELTKNKSVSKPTSVKEDEEIETPKKVVKKKNAKKRK